jgi:hypothetical protein
MSDIFRIAGKFARWISLARLGIRPKPSNVVGEADIGGLTDDRGIGRAHEIKENGLVDGARVEVGVPVGAGPEVVA